MSTYRIAVTWQMAGFIDVEANSLDDAIDKLREQDRAEGVALPDGDYVGDSFQIDDTYEEIIVGT